MSAVTLIEPVGRMARLLARLVNAVTGPRGRWVTIAVWVVLAGAGVVLHGRLGDVTAAMAVYAATLQLKLFWGVFGAGIVVYFLQSYVRERRKKSAARG